MYCSQCGKKIAETSKYCSGCGSPILEEEEFEFSAQNEVVYDSVKCIQNQLDEAERQGKTLRIKNDPIRTLVETIKNEAYEAGLANDKQKEKILENKKKIISDFPLPRSVKELLHFAKNIDSIISSKKAKQDPLTEVWEEKLKQVYRMAKKEFSATVEFIDIKNFYKDCKQRKRRRSAQPFVLLLLYPIGIGIIISLINNLPFLFFAAILSLFWNIFLILYVHNSLDRMILSVKKQSNIKNSVPKLLRIIAWFLLMPALAALITSIVYHSVGFIVLFSMLFGVDAFFLLLFLGDIYGW